MFRIASAEEIVSARSALARILASGAYRESSNDPYLYIYSRPRFWAAFRDEPRLSKRGEKVWYFYFGIQDAQKSSIEINFPIEFKDKILAGRIVIDEHGRPYLAHKGGLGGGPRASVSRHDFMRLISGFYEEEIEWPSGSTERVIVIGAIEYPSFLDRLTEYVNEAERLHQLARKNSLGSSGQNVDTGFKAGLSGRTTVKASPEHEADLFHDKVLEALHGALKNYGIQATNNRHADMCPDLYTNDSNGHLQCLFEIKTRHNTTSLYTGIGQLAVYGADQTIQPKRILVCPGLHHHPNFAAALKQHGIEFLKYQIDDKENVGFPDICALMKRLTCK